MINLPRGLQSWCLFSFHELHYQQMCTSKWTEQKNRIGQKSKIKKNLKLEMTEDNRDCSSEFETHKLPILAYLWSF